MPFDMFQKLKPWLPMLAAFVFPLLAIYVWWGGFRSVSIVETERGPYVYAYFDHVGDFAKISKTQSQVRAAMKAQGLEAGMPIGVLLDDPRKVERPKLRAQAGFLIDPTVTLKPPLKRGEVAKRPVWLAQVQAVVLLAPGKAYQALGEHLQTRQQDIRMPTVELYDSPPEPWRIGQFNLEMAR